MDRLSCDIAVTGFGCITAVGNGAEALLEAQQSGVNGLRPIPSELTGGREGYRWARAEGFKATDFIAPLKARKLDRSSQFCVAAAGLALQDAGLARGAIAPERIGIAVGCGFGGIANSVEFLSGFMQGGVAGLAPMLFPNTVANAAAGNASIEFGIKGPNITFIQRFCSAESAVMAACRFIEEGRADIMLAGGVDDLTPQMIRGFAATGQLRRHAADFGEGAGLLVLERIGHARERDATVSARLTSIAGIGLLLPGAELQGVGRLLACRRHFDRMVISGVESAAAPLSDVVDAAQVYYPGRLVGRSLAMGGTALGLLSRLLPHGASGLHLAASPEGPFYAVTLEGGDAA